MWTLFKLIRWLLTGAAAWWLFSMTAGEGMTVKGSLLLAMLYGQFVFWPLLVLWVVPAMLRHRPPRPKKHDPATFNPDVAHDNIAMDFGRDKLWLRDPVRGERIFSRGDVLTVRTANDWNNGVCRQRLEFQVRDVAHPLWQVFFLRHSDRWIKSSNRNGEEVNEWIARLRAWLNAAPSKPSPQPSAADKEYTLSELYQAYIWAGTDDDARQNWLVAFDIHCFTQGLDARKEWARLGGVYPGPSQDLLRMQGT